MRRPEDDNQWVKFAIDFEHANGQTTTMYVQTDDKRFVLSEHPDNKGPCVWDAATKVGDEIIRSNVETNPKNTPENFQLYAERRDGRFDQWQARTTQTENISTEPNRYEYKPSEWLWKNSVQTEQVELERQLGTALESGQQSQSRLTWAEQQQQQLNETALPSIDQSGQLRQAVQEQQSRQAAQEATQHNEVQETQRQRHER